MQRLRQQVDKIDLKLLKLLQQRTKLSGEIGRAKRRHGAEIYVPDRERELLARVAAAAQGKFPPAAITAIFREILSSSRAAQGQAPIGLLRKDAKTILPAARGYFGSCDRFVTKDNWTALAKEFTAGRLAVALLTLADLAAMPRGPGAWPAFFSRMTIVGDFSPGPEERTSLAERIFIVKPRKKATRMTGNRLMILIECKITDNAVKSLLTSMPYRPIHAEHVTLPSPAGRKGSMLGLLGVTLPKAIDDVGGARDFLAQSGIATSIAGIYPASEDYGG
jgi:chorismate mutase